MPVSVRWVLAVVSVTLTGCAVHPPLTSGERPGSARGEGRAVAGPGDALPLLALGDASARSGDFESAYLLLRAADRAAPGNALTLYYTGLVQEARGDYEGALALYEGAPRPSPFETEIEERSEWVRGASGQGPVARGEVPPDRPTASPVDVRVAIAALSERGVRPLTEDLVASRLASMGRNLGGLLGPGLGARDPAAEVFPPGLGLSPLPTPLPPPGGN